MRRLRLQFALFFVLLAASLGFFVWNSYRQLGREEREHWRRQAEEVYNQMQAAVSDFLTAEDARRWSEYRFGSSPLSRPPRDDARGLIGYFQMDPDGVFSTPYLPAEGDVGREEFPDGADGRRELFVRLRTLTVSLRTEKGRLETPAATAGYVELGQLQKTAPEPKEMVSRNVYPNPVQEQAVRLERRKKSPSKLAMLPGKKDAYAEIEDLGAPAADVLADPFQARLVDDAYLLFYRKVWVDHRQYLQGFAVELDRFYSWLMDQSYANSELPEFALARLELQGRSLAQYGIIDLSVDGLVPFFVRALGYPLNLFDWRVYASDLPRLGTRLFLNALSAAVVLLVTIGLYLIYRTAASQVAYSRKRQDFVSAVTHELKTPLTSIRMYSEMLEDGWAKDEDKRKEYYHHISKESGRLSRMIENVLRLARLEKKTYALNLKKDVPTRDFEDLCAELRKIAERQGFSLSVHADADLPALSYDPEAVKQIFLSLLDNSLKFGADSPDKTLEAAVERDGDFVVWRWGDRGPGVPERELGKVFEDFYRVENEMTRKTQGTGIGLAMSRMLAKAMDAEIQARNRTGGGLEVILRQRVS